jgi:type I restriction enzyme, S subunit
MPDNKNTAPQPPKGGAGEEAQASKGQQIQPLNPLKGTLPPDLLKEENLVLPLQGAGGLGWTETTLGEVVKIKNEKLKIEKLTLDNYISTENLLPDRLGVQQSANLPNIPSVNAFKKGDTLFSNIRTYFKKVWFARFDGGASNDVLVFTPKDEEKLDKKFLYYFISSDYFIDFTVVSAKGTKMPRGDKEAIKTFPILLPPLPEQQAIASVLSAFDDKIELLREQNKTLEEMGQVIFREKVAPKSPKGDLKNGELPLQGVGGLLPEGWRVGKLGEVCEITSGKRPESISETKTESHQIPLLGATKVMGYVEKYLFDEKTLVIGRVGTHGEVQRFNEKIFPSDNTLVLKSDNFIFVYLILKNIDYVKMNRGAVQPLITQTDLKNYPIVIPPEEVFQAFKEATNPIFDKIDDNNSQIQSLARSLDELLPRLMRGEVRYIEPVEMRVKGIIL